MTELRTQPGSQPVGSGQEPLLRVDRMSRHFNIGNALSRHTLHAVERCTVIAPDLYPIDGDLVRCLRRQDGSLPKADQEGSLSR